MILWLSGTVGASTLAVDQLAEHDHSTKMVHKEDGKVAPWSIQGENAWGTFDGGYIGYSGSSQSHIHSLDISTAIGNNLPPYYALSMIMRVA